MKESPEKRYQFPWKAADLAIPQYWSPIIPRPKRFLVGSQDVLWLIVFVPPTNGKRRDAVFDMTVVLQHILMSSGIVEDTGSLYCRTHDALLVYSSKERWQEIFDSVDDKKIN